MPAGLESVALPDRTAPVDHSSKGAGVRGWTFTAWASLLLIGLPGCRCSPPESSKPQGFHFEEVLAREAAQAHRVATGDLNADGRPELVIADSQALRVVDLSGAELARLPAPGGIQVLRVADLDGDGRAEILTGWGRSREHRNAKARINIYRLTGQALVEELVAQPPTSRSDVVEVLPIAGASPPELLVAHFESKYMVRVAKAQLQQGRWSLEPIDTIRMATSYALGDVDGDGQADLVVGRVYGDDIELPGDAFILRPDGSRVPIPVVGGVRSLHLADVDGDGKLDVLLGDGWDRDYGRKARALLTMATWRDGAFQAQVLEESADQYTFWDIVTVDVNGDGVREIVTRGSKHIRALSRKGDRWEGAHLASACRHIAPLLGGKDALLALCSDGARVLPGAR